jgi:hypothetical protein
MGYSAFIRTERAGWALGDRPHGVRYVPSDFAIVPKTLESSLSSPHRVLAALHPRILRHAWTVDASAVAAALRTGMLAADLGAEMPDALVGSDGSIRRAA